MNLKMLVLITALVSMSSGASDAASSYLHFSPDEASVASDIAQIQQIVRSQFAGPMYLGLQAANVANDASDASVRAETWRSSGNLITTASGNKLSVETSRNSTKFQISTVAKTASSCERLTSADWGTGVYQLRIGSAVFQGSVVKAPLAHQACSETTNITWFFD